jgi:hypothetical protein
LEAFVPRQRIAEALPAAAGTLRRERRPALDADAILSAGRHD